MKIFKINSISKEEITESFKDVVVIPTETVYGLAGRIDNDLVLQNIYKIKNRASDNPLIVHISHIEMLYNIIDGEIPDLYTKIIEKYWPGPLTLIFKSSPKISKIVMGSAKSTVAVRMPASEEIRKIIKFLGVPLAAPSANTSGKPSPTNIQHVIDDLGDKVKTYIDGGPCCYGLESTVISLLNNKLHLLRPGLITKEELEKITGEKIICKNTIEPNEEILCPGIKYKHYSPSISVYTFIGENWQKNMFNEIDKTNLKVGVAVISAENTKAFSRKAHIVVNMGESLVEVCKNCFSVLLNLEKKCDIIFIQGCKKTDEGLAIMDRLEKASSKIFK